MVKPIKSTVGTKVRTLALFVALINQILITLGISPLPFDEAGITETVSAFALGITALWTWWKNNSFTKHAIKADIYKEQIK